MRHALSGPSDWTQISPPSPCRAKVFTFTLLRPGQMTRRPQVTLLVRESFLLCQLGPAAATFSPSFFCHRLPTFQTGLFSHVNTDTLWSFYFLFKSCYFWQSREASSIFDSAANMKLANLTNDFPSCCLGGATLKSSSLRFVYIQEVLTSVA